MTLVHTDFAHKKGNQRKLYAFPKSIFTSVNNAVTVHLTGIYPLLAMLSGNPLSFNYGGAI